CSYGFYVLIQHPGGYTSLYGHFSRIEVQQGQAVKQGQEIGRSGSTGHSTGPHVHFALYFQGRPFDPLTVLPNDGVKIMPGSNIVN
ncbi:MAG TPA: M23 family metallopeptidase, partial [Dehalococcoidia bacterium]|nr:M23 family metallopeptidase [Dehalococcoidia bacterium]